MPCYIIESVGSRLINTHEKRKVASIQIGGGFYANRAKSDSRRPRGCHHKRAK